MAFDAKLLFSKHRGRPVGILSIKKTFLPFESESDNTRKKYYHYTDSLPVRIDTISYEF